MTYENPRRKALDEIRARAEAKAKQDKIELVTHALTGAVVGATLLIKAHRAAKRGDYAKATYYAVLWVGFSNNSNTAINRKLDEIRPNSN